MTAGPAAPPSAPADAARDAWMPRAATAAVSFGLLFNNVLRWAPFPAGRSVNDFTELESNALGIVVNVATYGLVLGVLALWRMRGHPLRVSRLMGAYCAFIAAQTFARGDLAREAPRSLTMIVMLLSADLLGSAVTRSGPAVLRSLREIGMAHVATILIGLTIGLVMRDAVNWGEGLSPSFENQNRAEFFFLYVLPHSAFAIALAFMTRARRRPGVLFLLSIVGTLLVPLLALRTGTRTINFSLLLVLGVFLLRYARTALLVGGALLAFAAAQLPTVTQRVADRLRVSELASSDEGVDATTGRLFLVLVNLQSFRDSPVIGQGAQGARDRVEASGSIAKTEHGYSIHLASYGSFAVLLFLYVIRGVVAASRIVLERTRVRRAVGPDVEPFGVALAAMAFASAITGFFWTFSSATQYFDWLAVVFVSAASGFWQLVRAGAPAGAETAAPRPAWTGPAQPPHPRLA